MNMQKITVSNLFGNFSNGKELLEHFTNIFGGNDGFFYAWRVYNDAISFLSKSNCERVQFPEVFKFADSLFQALET